MSVCSSPTIPVAQALSPVFVSPVMLIQEQFHDVDLNSKRIKCCPKFYKGYNVLERRLEEELNRSCECDSLRAKVDCLEGEVVQLEAKSKALKKTLKDTNIDKLRFRSKLKEYMRKAGERVQLIDEDREVFAMQKDADTARAATRLEEVKNKQLKADLAEALISLDYRKRYVAQLRTRNNKLNIELKDANAKVCALNVRSWSDIASARRESSKISEINRQQVEIGRLSAELTGAIDRVSAMQRKLDVEARLYQRDKEKLTNELKIVTAHRDVLATRSKNRGRCLKKYREKHSKWKKYFPKRKLKGEVKPRAQRYRTAYFKERSARFLHELSLHYTIYLPEYGELEVRYDDGNEEEIPYVKLRKTSKVSEKIQKFLKLHDSGISKKKLHECRMLAGGIPPIYRVNEAQKELNDQILKDFRIEQDANKFIVNPEDVLRWVLDERCIEGTELHMVIEADGRKSGYLDTAVVDFRLLNEGRLVHRDDRTYFLALARGKESYELVRDELRNLRKNLEDLQANGHTHRYADGRVVQYKVLLHFLSDGKFLMLARGMVSFRVKGCNCLFCFCSSEDRAKVWTPHPEEAKRWATVDKELGCVKPDLFPFIPVERQWIENMHLVLRFLMDRLISSGWTDIINDEFASPEQGMLFIEEQMRGEDIKIGHFRMYAKGKHDDPSAETKLGWTGLSFVQVLDVAEHFDFQRGYGKHRAKGKILQETISNFCLMYKEIVVWPGDGPEVSSQAIFLTNATLLAKLIGISNPDEQTPAAEVQDEEGSSGYSDDSAEPGEEGHVDNSFPLSTITPYAHMFCAHWGQQYERSIALAKFFQPFDQQETRPGNRGGLKFALTQALERSNLKFFHKLFQTLDKRTDELMERAGMQIMRYMVNPAVIDRSKFFCMWCGRGAVYRRNHAKHQASCSQAPPATEYEASAYVVMEGKLAKQREAEEALSRARSSHSRRRRR